MRPGKQERLRLQRYPRAAGELRTSNARRLAAVRVSTPSFVKISRTCFFTVDSLLPRMVAISPLVLPWASQSSDSATRGVRPSTSSSGLADSKLGLNSGTACWTARSRRERMAARRSGRDRLGQVIIRTKVHTCTDVGLLAFRSEEDKWDCDRFRIGPESGNDTESVEFGHHHVAKNEVGLFLFSQLYAEAPVRGG